MKIGTSERGGRRRNNSRPKRLIAGGESMASRRRLGDGLDGASRATRHRVRREGCNFGHGRRHGAERRLGCARPYMLRNRCV
jgi:hypothetical protein